MNIIHRQHVRQKHNNQSDYNKDKGGGGGGGGIK
jgi:hypothetical protein